METFLFLDLVGFTALTAEFGDDDAAEVALSLYRFVRSLLPEHGAEEVKTLGDGMMLRCSDPERAIRLGVRITEGPGLLPPVRVGVHTGSAVLREGDWYGAGVNVASRLCSVAGGGEVLVSDETRRAAGELEAVELSGRRLHWLKNVPEPIEAWLAGPTAECVPTVDGEPAATVKCGQSTLAVPRFWRQALRTATI